jgi:hypothetical protein
MTKISNPAPAVDYPPHLLERAVARIAPFFNDGSGQFTDEICRCAARDTIASLMPVTARELQLAAQIAALEMAALDCLRCSTQMPTDQLEPLLRMQEDAIRLHNMSSKARRTLQARQCERHEGQVGDQQANAFDEAEFNVMMNKARGMVTFARARGEASRVVQDMENSSAGSKARSPSRRKAVKAWAEDLQNLTGWDRQTQH